MSCFVRGCVCLTFIFINTFSCECMKQTMRIHSCTREYISMDAKSLDMSYGESPSGKNIELICKCKFYARVYTILANVMTTTCAVP